MKTLSRKFLKIWLALLVNKVLIVTDTDTCRHPPVVETDTIWVKEPPVPVEPKIEMTIITPNFPDGYRVKCTQTAYLELQDWMKECKIAELSPQYTTMFLEQNVGAITRKYLRDLLEHKKMYKDHLALIESTRQSPAVAPVKEKLPDLYPQHRLPC